MKGRKKLLRRIMVECPWQAPVLALLSAGNSFPSLFLPGSRWVFSSLATNRLTDGEGNACQETKDKSTCSIAPRNLTYKEVSDSRRLDPPSIPLGAKAGRPGVEDLSQKSVTQTDRFHAFKEDSTQVPVLQAALQGKNRAFSADLVEQVLRAVMNDWESGLRVFLWAGQQPGYRHTPGTLDLMVLILGKAQQFRFMWQLLEEMEKEAYLIRPKTFEVIIRSYVKAGMLDAAVGAFERMKSFGWAVDTAALNTLVRVLCYEKRVQDCQVIFERLKRSNPPDQKTYSLLIHGWCETNRLTEALGVLEEMIQEGFHPTLGAYTSLIEALCAKNMVEIAKKLFNHMKNNILCQFSKTKEATEDLEDFGILKEITPSLDSVSYNCLVTSMCRLGEAGDACELLEEMVRRGFTPDTRTYSNVFALLCKRRKAKEAFQLYHKMLVVDCFPCLRIHDNLIEMFCCTGHVSMALDLWNKVREKGYGCRRESYSVLIHGLCYNNHFEEAFEHFKQMIVKGIVPLYQTYRMLHFGLLKEGNMERFDELMEKIKQLEEKGIHLSTRRK